MAPSSTSASAWRPRAELTPSHPALGDVDSPEALERYQAAKREHKAKMRAQRAMRDHPGAIAYVTRAAPVEWELLLFDVIGEPEYTAVVPGGGIEPGETAGGGCRP